MNQSSCMDKEYYFHDMSSTKMKIIGKKVKCKEQFIWRCLSLHSTDCLYRVSVYFAVM
jgi:hypothetical protein